MIASEIVESQPTARSVSTDESADLRDERYAWFVVAALSLVNMVSYIERQIPTLLFGPIKKQFAISDTEVSLLACFAFVLFYVGFGLIVGRLADRVNRRTIIGVGVVLWSLATMSCGFARSFASLFTSRILVGVGEATLAPSATSILADYFPKDRLARALGVYTGAQFMGAGLALVVGGFAIEMVSLIAAPVLPLLGKVAPWQMTFLVTGAIGSLVLLPLFFVKEPIRGALSAAAKSRGDVDASLSLAAFLRRDGRTLAAHFGAFSISSALGFGTVAWMPTYFVRVHHWAVHDIGYVYGLMLAFLGCAGVLAGTRFAEWVAGLGYEDFYFRAPILSMTVTAFPAALAPLMPTSMAALDLIAIATFLSSFPVALIYSVLPVITPGHLRGQITALYLFAANVLGVGMGPTLVALITDYVYRDEMAVGYSIATATLIVTPIVVLILCLGLSPLRESLARSQDAEELGR